MSELFVVFPKESIFTSKSSEAQRIIERDIKWILDNITDPFKGDITYMPDDALADRFLGFSTKSRYISLIHKQDVAALVKYGEQFNVMNKSAIGRYELALNVDTPICKTIHRPIRTEFRSTDEWLKARIEGIPGIINACMKEYASESGRNVLVIEDNIQNNRLSMSKCNVHDGDGRLFIQACLYPSLKVNAYMGGMYVDESTMKMILESMEA